MELFKLLGTIAINNSEANRALKETSSAAKDTADDISGASASSEKSSSKIGTAFKKIGSGALAVGKAVGVGMVAAGTAVTALVTKSIQAYADYEQLVGGVETLFKDSAGKVQEYAKNAYKTAGLSANAYMETVTSFSASLLQSLDGDTNAAAERANLAITDMSDNANKMGTDMSMIQNAYQGFAKQNYTMLDNLKLGYGGTKAEMERLIDDANTVKEANGEMADLSMSSFSDIVEAIHIIQTEMGITGTTAKEAATTISGSVSSMKSAWVNLLTAMADDNADFGGYVTAFVDSVATVANNLMPRISIALKGVVQLIEQLAPVIIGAIPDLMHSLLPSIITAATGILNSIVAIFPDLVSAIMGILPTLIDGFVQIINALIAALPSIIETLVAALPSLIPALIDGLVAMIVMLCTNFAQIIQPIIDHLPEIIVSIVDALMNNLPALIMGVGQLILGLAQAIPQMHSAVREAVKSALLNIIGHLGEWLAPIFEVVSTFFSGVVEWLNTNVIQPVINFFQGLWEGIKVVWDGICNAVSIAVQLIASILDAAFQIITLPFRFIWENCKEYVFAAWDWIKNAVSTAINAVKTTITNVMNAISNFLTPILNTIKTTFSTVWENIKSAVSTAINAVKTTVTNVFNSVKDTVSNIWNGVKTTISNVVNSIKTTISNVFNSVKDTVGNIFNSIKEKMSAPIEKARDTIKGIVDKIKGFFSGMNISFPHIKMPHFGISPKGWKIGDLLKGDIPKLSIDWYAKAMDNPIVMTKPTIWGYDPETGNLQGGGEAGSEVVTGTNTLMTMIRTAVAAQNEAIIYYLNKIIEILAAYFPQLIDALGFDIRLDSGELVGRLAPAMNEALGKISTRKDRGR